MDSMAIELTITNTCGNCPQFGNLFAGIFSIAIEIVIEHPIVGT